jgi:hypothetical protein
MTRRTRPALGALAAAAVVAVALTGLGAPAAYALWRASATAAATVSGGAVGTPTALTCTSITSPRVARLAWQAVPGATSYSVVLTRDTFGDTAGPFTTPTNTIDINSGLLGGLGGLLAGAVFTAKVQPVYASPAWVGGVSAGLKVQLFSILGGMSCA